MPTERSVKITVSFCPIVDRKRKQQEFKINIILWLFQSFFIIIRERHTFMFNSGKLRKHTHIKYCLEITTKLVSHHLHYTFTSLIFTLEKQYAATGQTPFMHSDSVVRFLLYPFQNQGVLMGGSDRIPASNTSLIYIQLQF